MKMTNDYMRDTAKMAASNITSYLEMMGECDSETPDHHVEYLMSKVEACKRLLDNVKHDLSLCKK